MFGRKKLQSENAALQQTVKQLVNQTQTLQIRDALGQSLGTSHNGKRDVYDIYGYPREIRFTDCYNLTRREPIAKRIAFGVPLSCWSDGFEIKVNEDPMFEDEIEKLKERGFLDAMERGHALARMGNYSIVLMGIPDQADLF
jgi:hypothetical protein